MPRGCLYEPWDRRFWKLVDKREPDECWEWQGSVGPKGYGTFGLWPGKWLGAHVASWIISQDFQTRPPKKRVVMHTCDNPRCVNPKHLAIGTVGANQIDMAQKWRSRSKLTSAQVAEIRASDEPYRVLAKRYGLKSHKSIANIKARRSFTHLD